MPCDGCGARQRCAWCAAWKGPRSSRVHGTKGVSEDPGIDERPVHTKRTSMSANSANRRRLKRCGTTCVSSRDAGGHRATQPNNTTACERTSVNTSSLARSSSVATMIVATQTMIAEPEGDLLLTRQRLDTTQRAGRTMERLMDGVDDHALVGVVSLGHRGVDREGRRVRAPDAIPLVEKGPPHVSVERTLGDRPRLEGPEQIVDARDDDGEVGEVGRATPPSPTMVTMRSAPSPSADGCAR